MLRVTAYNGPQVKQNTHRGNEMTITFDFNVYEKTFQVTCNIDDVYMTSTIEAIKLNGKEIMMEGDSELDGINAMDDAADAEFGTTFAEINEAALAAWSGWARV